MSEHNDTDTYLLLCKETTILSTGSLKSFMVHGLLGWDVEHDVSDFRCTSFV